MKGVICSLYGFKVLNLTASNLLEQQPSIKKEKWRSSFSDDICGLLEGTKLTAFASKRFFKNITYIYSQISTFGKCSNNEWHQHDHWLHHFSAQSDDEFEKYSPETFSRVEAWNIVFHLYNEKCLYLTSYILIIHKKPSNLTKQLRNICFSLKKLIRLNQSRKQKYLIGASLATTKRPSLEAKFVFWLCTQI